MRRSQALDATSLLIDQNRGVAADRVTEVADKPPQRIGRGHIALKQNKAPGVGFLDELPFRGSETGSRQTRDKGAHLQQSGPNAR